MIWVALAACLLATGAVAYSVFSRNKEATGMGQVSRWRKSWVPITVIVSEDFLPEETAKLLDAVKRAIRFWNGETGVMLFADPTDVGRGAVIPVMRHDPLTMDNDAVAYAAIGVGIDGSLKNAAIYMNNWENLSAPVIIRAVKHELGHCLGLEHDDIEFSVMYGKASSRIYCVSPADKEFLRNVYGETT